MATSSYLQRVTLISSRRVILVFLFYILYVYYFHFFREKHLPHLHFGFQNSAATLQRRFPSHSLAHLPQLYCPFCNKWVIFRLFLYFDKYFLWKYQKIVLWCVKVILKVLQNWHFPGRPKTYHLWYKESYCCPIVSLVIHVILKINNYKTQSCWNEITISWVQCAFLKTWNTQYVQFELTWRWMVVD